MGAQYQSDDSNWTTKSEVVIGTGEKPEDSVKNIMHGLRLVLTPYRKAGTDLLARGTSEISYMQPDDLSRLSTVKKSTPYAEQQFKSAVLAFKKSVNGLDEEANLNESFRDTIIGFDRDLISSTISAFEKLSNCPKKGVVMHCDKLQIAAGSDVRDLGRAIAGLNAEIKSLSECDESQTPKIKKLAALRESELQGLEAQLKAAKESLAYRDAVDEDYAKVVQLEDLEGLFINAINTLKTVFYGNQPWTWKEK